MGRFGVALAAAASLHVGLIVLAWGQRALAPRSLPRAEVEVDVFEVADLRQAPEPPRGKHMEPPAPLDDASVPPRAVADLASPKQPVAQRAPDAPLVDAAAVDSMLSSTATGTESEPPKATPRRIDLGLGSSRYKFDLIPPERPPPPARSPTIQRRLRAELHQRDVRLGLGRSGPMISTTRRVVQRLGPVRGRAIFRVSVDAHGKVVRVELVDGVYSEWRQSLAGIGEALASSNTSVPAGARGLSIDLEVVAKVQRVSGEAVGSASVDIDKVLPLSVHGHFDVADLSGIVQRIVSARVLSETPM